MSQYHDVTYHIYEEVRSVGYLHAIVHVLSLLDCIVYLYFKIYILLLIFIKQGRRVILRFWTQCIDLIITRIKVSHLDLYLIVMGFLIIRLFQGSKLTRYSRRTEQKSYQNMTIIIKFNFCSSFLLL